ncbi:type II toxin-antitoxin system Phd/YefM family antitoxin [Sphingobium sp. TB-6]|uniref:type II toxin-antitoxin system Phd/YefM family antitoxin n=1 Tax=Sphingobium sp. TB-6 TaxID=2728850 RepID=UPI00146F3ADB|nr:type II toxin-antitoxin system prevent-host-death family antitoxin [Sphingobium sp. TB-6]NML88169.1 type II toxin-antitoxin system Phd/YefM family antitoxin [Sphingobium sp. TB-6]
MDTVNIHEAKTHLSRLIDRVASSGGFIIAKAGKPVAKIVPLNAPDSGKAKRLGFMAGQLRVPADFDRMGEQEIEVLFGGQS